jgi:CubicO group peptidase (beta-lactamase class C family)
VDGPELARLLREHLSRHVVPGAAVGVLRGTEVSTAYVGTADLASGEPVTAETCFAVGSLGKAMVATAVARLAAAGRLALDDPIAAHVPELRGSSWAEADTIRDLLANRSRIPLRDEFEFGASPADGDDVLSRFAANIATGDPSPDVWSYTNAGWCLVGRALETVAGLTWEEAMRVHVFDPLGMEHATFVASPIAEPRAAGHNVTPHGAVPVAPWSPRSLGPAGSTPLCTLSDVLRFAREHLDDPSLALLRTTHAEVRIHAWLDAWCLGWARFDWPGGPVWGWDGLISGQRAILRLIPGRGAAALLTNADRGRVLYRSLFGELMQESFGIRMPSLMLEPSGGSVDELPRFAGVYAWPDRRVEVTATESGLRIEEDAEVVHAVPLDERTALVDRGDPDNPTVTFDGFDDSGRPDVLYRMLWALPRA